jgi:hypothetical protein
LTFTITGSQKSDVGGQIKALNSTSIKAAAAGGLHAVVVAVVAVLFCGVLGPHLREQLRAAAAIIT